MKHEKVKRDGLRTAFLAVAALLMGFGTIQIHAAEQCNSLQTDLAGVIGGSPNCADFGRVGVTVSQGDTQSEVFESANCWFKVTTAAPVGSTDSEKFTVDGNCPGELVLTQGATGGQSCQYVHPKGVTSDTVKTLNEKGDAVRSKALTVCTDEVAFVGTPRLLLEVYVSPDAAGCETSSLETIEIDVGDTVAFCYRVTNAGDVPLAQVNVSGATGDFPATLEPGESANGFKTQTYTEAGTFPELATATGSDGSTTPVTSNLDTAVVTVEALPEAPTIACDLDTEGLSSETGRLSASWDPRTPDTDFECGVEPEGQDPFDDEVNRSGKRQCLNQCVLADDGESCERSGEWEAGNFCEPTGEGALPYCWEIRENPTCEISDFTPVPAKYWKETSKTVTYLRKNPYIMQSCTSSGGRETCITYCFLYPGETASACPPGSWVY
jgi:hypothetical protein